MGDQIFTARIPFSHVLLVCLSTGEGGGRYLPWLRVPTLDGVPTLGGNYPGQGGYPHPGYVPPGQGTYSLNIMEFYTYKLYMVGALPTKTPGSAPVSNAQLLFVGAAIFTW